MTHNSCAIYPSLKGKVVFVSGGGSGIGASIVEGFVRQGARVGFIDIDDTASDVLVRKLKSAEATLRFVHCDVRDIGQLRAAIGVVQSELGDVAVLVNNAARDDRHAVESVTVEYWDERLAVNLRHQFFAAQTVVEQMKRLGGGSIINFGSISWMTATGGMPAYTTSKAAVHGLTRGLARDFGPFNIRANTVSPGWVMTERQKNLWLTPEGERELEASQCLKGRLQPDDIANMVLFLASDDAKMVTSQNFVVDAGWT
ncbi:MAG: SDR family NAD(P)-dependent oxidoreductase [Burkholderiales bacterium]|jgi:NAD(P)-dependent dehydrogenase (short-subunit alcohol dehydrogenase family)